jgi:hypothetical protein
MKKNILKRTLALLLAAMMLVSVAACTGNENSSDTTPAGTEGSTQAIPGTQATDTEAATEGETVYMPEDFEVTEQNGSASVVTPMGLAYDVTGYSAMDQGTVTFTEGLTYTFSDDAFSELVKEKKQTEEGREQLEGLLTGGIEGGLQDIPVVQPLTDSYIEQLGEAWSEITPEYLDKYLSALDGMDLF